MALIAYKLHQDYTGAQVSDLIGAHHTIHEVSSMPRIKYPDLQQNEMGPQDPARGICAISSFLLRNEIASAIRLFTSDAEIRAALQHVPHLIDRLRKRPGPYSQYVAEHDAQLAADAIEDVLAKNSGHFDIP